MAIDFAVYYLMQPLGLAVQLLLLTVPPVLLRLFAPNAFSKLGFRRIAWGQLSVAVVTLLLCAYSAYALGHSKADLGHIRLAPAWSPSVSPSVSALACQFAFPRTMRPDASTTTSR